jgi:hypothetical protein
MATTTTNFGWDIPQSTDLVKDGATAIAALGQDIDTAMVDLKGGTTGQVLAKASGTDLDFSWVAQDDSNAIQNAIVDAKGDLIAATANDTPARLAVGTNGQVLTADSTAATGLAWATAGGGNGPAFQAYSTPAQSISSTTNTKATMTNEAFDTDNNFASSRFTPTKAGYYLITGSISYTAATDKTCRVLIYKNGSNYGTWNAMSIGAAVANPTLDNTVLMYMNGSTDYCELYGWTDSASAEFYQSTMQGVWIRS